MSHLVLACGPWQGTLFSSFPTALIWGYVMLLKQLSSSHSISMVRHIAWALGRVTQPLCFPYMAGRDLLCKVSTTWRHGGLQICCGHENLITPVWWLGIRLINFLTPGWWNILLLSHTFTMHSLMPLLLQSLQGSCAWLVPFLINLSCSLFLASNVINYSSS